MKKINLNDIKCPKCNEIYINSLGYNFSSDEVFECSCGCVFGISVKEVIDNIYIIEDNIMSL